MIDNLHCISYELTVLQRKWRLYLAKVDAGSNRFILHHFSVLLTFIKEL